MIKSARIPLVAGAVSSVFADSGVDTQGDWELIITASSGSTLVFCDDVSGNGLSMVVSTSVSGPSRIRVRDSEVFAKNIGGSQALDLNVILTQV